MPVSPPCQSRTAPGMLQAKLADWSRRCENKSVQKDAMALAWLPSVNACEGAPYHSYKAF